MGIDKYNAECRAIVMRYSGEWEKTVKRLGRWIEFDNGYKTMNVSFMESVWWVFKQARSSLCAACQAAVAAASAAACSCSHRTAAAS